MILFNYTTSSKIYRNNRINVKSLFFIALAHQSSNSFAAFHTPSRATKLSSSYPSVMKTISPNDIHHDTFAMDQHFPNHHRNERKLFMSSSSFRAEIKNINKQQMQSIIEQVAKQNGSNPTTVDATDYDGTKFVIIDVRNPDEVQYTGKISEHAHTLPLPYILQTNALTTSDPGDFVEMFGFEKPDVDDIDTVLVFTCKAGIRSVQASQFALMAGYTNVWNYMGGANEWFS